MRRLDAKRQRLNDQIWALKRYRPVYMKVVRRVRMNVWDMLRASSRYNGNLQKTWSKHVNCYIGISGYHNDSHVRDIQRYPIQIKSLEVVNGVFKEGMAWFDSHECIIDACR